YRYKVPGDHTPGLAWYHAHVHGATTLHLLQGLVGALVVLPPPSLNMPAFLRSSAVPQHLLVLTHHPLCSCNPTFNIFKCVALCTTPLTFPSLELPLTYTLKSHFTRTLILTLTPTLTHIVLGTTLKGLTSFWRVALPMTPWDGKTPGVLS